MKSNAQWILLPGAIMLVITTQLAVAATPATELLQDRAQWERLCSNRIANSPFDQFCADIIEAGPGRDGRQANAAAGLNLELNSAQHRISASQQADAVTAREDSEQKVELWQSERTGLSLIIRAGRLERDADDFETAFKTNSRGLRLVGDYRFDPKLTLGGVLLIEEADTNYSESRGQMDTSYQSLTTFLNWQIDQDWWADVYAGYGQVSFDIQRNVRMELNAPDENVGFGDKLIESSATGKRDANQLALGVNLGTQWRVETTELGFNMGLDYLRFTSEAYEEKERVGRIVTTPQGGTPYQESTVVGIALAYDKSTFTSLRGTLGVSAAWPKSFSKGVLVPQIRMDYQHEFDDDANNTKVAFLGDQARERIDVSTAEPDRDSIMAAVSIQWVMPNAVSAFIEYEQRFAHDYLEERNVSLGIRTAF